jgi:hypothetical protein
MRRVYSYFRFYEELNRYLPKERRKQSFAYQFQGRPSIEGCVEDLGVPGSEIDLILVGGEPTGLDYQLKGREHISVYPVFESFDISGTGHLHSKPLRKTKFILDAGLKELGQKLQSMGYDSLDYRRLAAEQIVQISRKERRIILTRNSKLLSNYSVTHGYVLINKDPKLQFEKVLKRFQLD